MSDLNKALADAVRAVIETGTVYAEKGQLPFAQHDQFTALVFINALARMMLASAAAEAAALGKPDAPTVKLAAHLKASHLLLTAHDLFVEFFDANAAELATYAALIRATNAAAKEGSVQ